jgi:O-acetylserine/cysteine efflux transporter
MALRDFFLLMAMCLIWASNNIISKIVVSDMMAPPLAYAAVRFALVALLTLPWLLPAPRPIWRMIVIAQLIGGLNFALLFVGFKTATPSAASIIIQLGVPMTTVLSMVMLGEQVRWRRGLGMALTLAGAVLVMWHPTGVKPMQFQAWVGFCSVWPLVVMSAFWEHDQVGAMLNAGWPFLAAVIYSAVIVSIIAHTVYYHLIQKYEATLISPLTLMTPLATIVMGVLITKDHFDVRMGIGAALALLGVLIVALRPNHVMPLILLLRNRAQ